MTRSQYGLLAGLAGAAFAWWWRRRGIGTHEAAGDNYGETTHRNIPDLTGLGGGPT